MWNVGCGMRDVGMRHGNIFPTDRRFSQKPCGVPLSKKHETRRSPTDRRGGNCTDAHGWVFSRILYSCSAAYCLGFDAPPAQRIATDFSHAENLSMRARFSGHALKGQKFIAQGKRSDTLGKPPHPITLRPVRAKANITRSVSVLLPLQQGASYTAHYIQGVASLALG